MKKYSYSAIYIFVCEILVSGLIAYGGSISAGSEEEESISQAVAFAFSPNGGIGFNVLTLKVLAGSPIELPIPMVRKIES